MFDGAVLVGEVFKHVSRDIWVQIKNVKTDVPASVLMGTSYHHNYVEFDVLVYDKPEPAEDDTDAYRPVPVLGLREFCVLFESSSV